MTFEMQKGTVCFHIPSKTNIPKTISWKAYLKMVGRKGYFCGYVQGKFLCLVKGESVIVLRKLQLCDIERLGGWAI